VAPAAYSKHHSSFWLCCSMRSQQQCSTRHLQHISVAAVVTPGRQKRSNSGAVTDGAITVPVPMLFCGLCSSCSMMMSRALVGQEQFQPGTHMCVYV
jgi:hypothetical protein